MKILRKPLSITLGLMATVVLLHFALSSFYEDSVDVGAVWDILNWIMAVGVIVTLATTCADKRDYGAACGDTSRFICVNAAFYAAAVLAVLFFWNWFDDLAVGEDGQSQTRLFYWVIVDVLFVLLVGTVSARLWRDAADA